MVLEIVVKMMLCGLIVMRIKIIHSLILTESEYLDFFFLILTAILLMVPNKPITSICISTMYVIFNNQ